MVIEIDREFVSSSLPGSPPTVFQKHHLGCVELVIFDGLYHGKSSSSNHHLGEYGLLFPSGFCKSKIKLHSLGTRKRRKGWTCSSIPGTFRVTYLSNDQKPDSLLSVYRGWNPTHLLRDFFRKDRHEPISISWFMSAWCFSLLTFSSIYLSFTSHTLATRV